MVLVRAAPSLWCDLIQNWARVTQIFALAGWKERTDEEREWIWRCNRRGGRGMDSMATTFSESGPSPLCVRQANSLEWILEAAIRIHAWLFLALSCDWWGKGTQNLGVNTDFSEWASCDGFGINYIMPFGVFIVSLGSIVHFLSSFNLLRNNYTSYEVNRVKQ
jgi:succinate dehydrogenase flavin-adding protein (antitoxin of CptAB toxin-antitoxin module)